MSAIKSNLFRTSIIISCLFLTLVSHPSAFAVSPTYLPLQVGNRWELRSPARNTAPMVFEVTSRSQDTWFVRWDSSFMRNVVYGFSPSGNVVMLRSLDLGTGASRLPDGTVYFDLESPGRKTWANLLGDFLVFETVERVETPSGAFADCRHIRYKTKQGADTDYFLAPGVGFVQVGTGPAAYKLVSFRRSDSPAPQDRRIPK